MIAKTFSLGRTKSLRDHVKGHEKRGRPISPERELAIPGILERECDYWLSRLTDCGGHQVINQHVLAVAMPHRAGRGQASLPPAGVPERCVTPGAAGAHLEPTR